jgi:hypothetical protein
VKIQRIIERQTYSSKEGKNVFDKVSLIVVELVVPVVKIGGKVDLLGCPESGRQREAERV